MAVEGSQEAVALVQLRHGGGLGQGSSSEDGEKPRSA